MGSGSRFQVWRSSGVGIGLNVSRFPFAVTLSAHFLLWGLSIGFGKGYDE